MATFALFLLAVVVFLLACVGACVCIGVVLHWRRTQQDQVDAEFKRDLNAELLRQQRTAYRRKQELRAIPGGRTDPPRAA